MAATGVPSAAYYDTYHGHEIGSLEAVLQCLRRTSGGVVFLAGDSSLDNKYWVTDQHEATNGYENALDPPSMKADVCYWLNVLLAQRQSPGQLPLCALNTAVEESTLGQRVGGWFSGLLDQDKFIQEHISENDYLLVSVGGNDIALSPTCSTVLSAAWLVHFASDAAVRDGSAFCFGHFESMFRDHLSQYLELLVQKRKPRKILVCMIYFPDLANSGGWADMPLAMLQYNRHPERLQGMISSVFEHAVRQIRIEGTEVVPVPLFRAMDGTCTGDYVERVEPSSQGGRKMAELCVDALFGPSEAVRP